MLDRLKIIRMANWNGGSRKMEGVMSADEIMEIEIDPEDVILLLLEANERVLGANALRGITRLEKLLFLLQKETDFEGIGTFFHFVAHNFGPFSKEVYEAVEFLESCELIDVRERPYSSYYANIGESQLVNEISDEAPEEMVGREGGFAEKLFQLTENGKIVAGKIRDAITRRSPDDIEAIKRIICRYGHLPLNQLIRYVYHKYPDTTDKSIHPEARRVKREA